MKIFRDIQENLRWELQEYRAILRLPIETFDVEIAEKDHLWTGAN